MLVAANAGFQAQGARCWIPLQTAGLWFGHPNLSSVSECSRASAGQILSSVPSSGLSQTPSMDSLEHHRALHEPTAALLWRCARSPSSLGGRRRRVFTAGSDTILPLSKHPWRAIIRLFWLLIRAAVHWITRPGWSLPAMGLLGASCRGLGRCHRGD